jgi:hypothetical protein
MPSRPAAVRIRPPRALPFPPFPVILSMPELTANSLTQNANFGQQNNRKVELFI